MTLLQMHKPACYLLCSFLGTIVLTSVLPFGNSQAQSGGTSDNDVVILVDLARISTQLHLAQDQYALGHGQNAFDHAFIPRTTTFPSLKPLLAGPNLQASVELESLLTEIPLKIKSGASEQDLALDIAKTDQIRNNITAQLGYASVDRNEQSKVIFFLLRDAVDSYQLAISANNEIDYQSSQALIDSAKSEYLKLNSTGAGNDTLLRSFSDLKSSVDSRAPTNSVLAKSNTIDQQLAQAVALDSDVATRQAYFDTIRVGLTNAVTQVRNSDYAGALQSVNSAYLDNFEYLEIPLEKHDVNLKMSIEREMRVDLRDAITSHSSADQVSSQVNTILQQLDTAKQLLKNDSISASAAGNQTTGFADIEALKQGFGSYAGARAGIGQTDQNSKSAVMYNVDQIRTKLSQMLDAYHSGDSAGALQISRSAYLDSYESIEVPLRPIDPDFTLDMEIKFAELRNLLQSNAPYPSVESKVIEIRKGLDESERLVSGPGVLAPAIAYSSSFSIIFREGLESALIIGAILTYLEASRNIKFKKQVFYGIVIAVAGTGATWFAAQYIIDISGASRDLIEAIASLSAVGVLFWVSFWILNKVETKRWIEFVKAKVWKATATGSMSVFVMLSFFTVYREGFETVLFYQAMLSFAKYMELYVIAGLLSGLAVIIGVTFLIRKLGKKLPLRVLFGLTMGIGAYMSIAFIGNAVREFQDVGYISTTSLIGYVPRFDINTATMTGIHPTLETIIAQLALLGVYLAGSLYMLVIQPRRKKLIESSRKSRSDLVEPETRKTGRQDTD